AVFIVLTVACFSVSTPGCSWGRTKGAKETARSAPAIGAPQPAITVKEPFGVPRNRWPLSTGVPFAPGAVHDISTVSIVDGQTAQPTQARLLSRWPDGSARWVLFDWQTDLGSRERRSWTVRPTVRPTGPAVRTADKIDQIEVDTGRLQFIVPKRRFAILDQVRVDGIQVTRGPVVAFFNIDGKRVAAQAPDTVRIAEAGPLRVRIETRGHYAAAFDYVVRIDAFANQPFVRVLHSFEQHSPEAYTLVRQIGIDVPIELGA